MDVEKEGIDRSNAIEEFPKYVDLSEAVILNNVGEEVSKGKAAFEVDIKKEYRDKNLKEELNPSLVVIKDNKPRWYLPETRRDGYRNLHKINRYGLLYRSDLVLKLEKNYNYLYIKYKYEVMLL